MSMRHHGPANGKDSFAKGSDLLSLVGGLVLTFFVAPLVYHASVDWAQGFAFANYGRGWDWIVALLWGLGCGFVTFAASQMLLAATFRLGLARLTSLIFRR